jgi:hypothetical protein
MVIIRRGFDFLYECFRYFFPAYENVAASSVELGLGLSVSVLGITHVFYIYVPNSTKLTPGIFTSCKYSFILILFLLIVIQSHHISSASAHGEPFPRVKNDITSTYPWT